MRRQFTAEFKRSIVLELESKSLTQVCREHCLHPATVSTWRSDYERNPQEAFKGHGNLWKPEAKIAQLERTLGALYAENDLLKKTLQLVQGRQAEERRMKRGVK